MPRSSHWRSSTRCTIFVKRLQHISFGIMMEGMQFTKSYRSCSQYRYPYQQLMQQKRVKNMCLSFCLFLFVCCLCAENSSLGIQMGRAKVTEVGVRYDKGFVNDIVTLLFAVVSSLPANQHTHTSHVTIDLYGNLILSFLTISFLQPCPEPGLVAQVEVGAQLRFRSEVRGCCPVCPPHSRVILAVVCQSSSTLCLSTIQSLCFWSRTWSRKSCICYHCSR